MLLRCTKKLLQRIEPSAHREGDAPRSTGTLGDWSANFVIVQRQQLVLAVSHVTLLPVILHLAPSKTFLARFSEAAGQVLRGLGIEQHKVASELGAMAEVMVTTTNDRRVLGTLNDFSKMLDFYLDERSLLEVSIHLADTPCSPIEWQSPRAATLAQFSKVGSDPTYPALRLVKG
jgi:hypothetical protein